MIRTIETSGIGELSTHTSMIRKDRSPGLWFEKAGRHDRLHHHCCCHGETLLLLIDGSDKTSCCCEVAQRWLSDKCQCHRKKGKKDQGMFSTERRATDGHLWIGFRRLGWRLPLSLPLPPFLNGVSIFCWRVWNVKRHHACSG